MKILLHTCCGPCTIYPLRILREQGQDLTGYYYNPNIHPYREYKHRAETLAVFAEEMTFPVIWADDYTMEDFFRLVAGREERRCELCYTLRLRQTAQTAKKQAFDAFTTTLLYSKFQKHDLIRKIGELMSRQFNIPFFYVDFREGWQEGVQTSKKREMYRQPFCGCIYSEKERFMSANGDNRFSRSLSANRKGEPD